MAWLETDGEELLAHHQDVCDNLKGIKAQQKDFDKLYFSAMVSETRATTLGLLCGPKCTQKAFFFVCGGFGSHPQTFTSGVALCGVSQRRSLKETWKERL